MDTNSDGRVDYKEFCEALIEKDVALQKTHLEAAFKFFDQDGDNYISVEELKAIFQGGFQGNDEIWKKLMTDVDSNGDGKISFEEF